MNEDILRRYFGFNDPNVIRGILNDPNQVARYTREYQGIINPQPQVKSPEQIAKEVTDAAQAEIKRETDFLKQYSVDNPFVFDEQAAKASSQAEYEPYYQNLLREYLQGVDIKRQSIQDDRQLLDKLNKLDTQAITRDNQYAIEKAQEGYNGEGLFFSGLKDRGTGRINIDTQDQNNKTQLQYGSQVGKLTGQEQQLNLDQGIQQRQIGEAQQEAVQSGIQQRLTEAQNPYYYNFTSAYKRAFPTGTQDVSAYLPDNYLRY